MVGRLGLEPRSRGLKVRSSTIELTSQENGIALSLMMKEFGLLKQFQNWWTVDF